MDSPNRRRTDAPNLTRGQLGFLAFGSLLGLVMGLVSMGSSRSWADWLMAGLVVAAGVLVVLALTRVQPPPPQTWAGRVYAWVEDSAWLGPMAGGFGGALLGGGVAASALVLGLPVASVVGYLICGLMGASTARASAMRRPDSTR